MIRLVYISQAVKPFSSEELLNLLRNARKRNTQNNITGTLLYCDECFMQVLEGPENSVLDTVNKIKQDSRHINLTELERTEITERQFKDWSMGFEEVNPEQLKSFNIDGLNSFFTEKTESGFINKHIMHPVMSLFKANYKKRHSQEELPIHHDQHELLVILHKFIRIAVSILAIFMVCVIFLGIFDVVYVVYQQLSNEPVLLLSIEELLITFGAFMAVLIGIEIFLNISLYLRTDVVPVKLVVATALMAISRKVIVFDFKNLEATYIYASAAVILALGLTYWLLNKQE